SRRAGPRARSSPCLWRSSTASAPRCAPKPRSAPCPRPPPVRRRARWRERAGIAERLSSLFQAPEQRKIAHLGGAQAPGNFAAGKGAVEVFLDLLVAQDQRIHHHAGDIV